MYIDEIRAMGCATVFDTIAVSTAVFYIVMLSSFSGLTNINFFSGVGKVESCIQY